MARRGRRQSGATANRRLHDNQFFDPSHRPTPEFNLYSRDPVLASLLFPEWVARNAPMEAPAAQPLSARGPSININSTPVQTPPLMPSKSVDPIFANYAKEDRARESRDLICLERAQRKEVLMAAGAAGGKVAKPKYTWRSKIKCP